MARAGRKRKAGQRQPNGQLKRDYNADKLRAAVVDQRMKHFRLTKEQALSDKAVSAIGRAQLYGQITEAQYQAGEEYLRRWVKHALVMGIPMPSARAIDYAQEVRGGERGDFSAYFAEKAKRQFHDMEPIGNAGHRLVKGVMLDEYPTGAWPCDQVDALKMALSQLVEIFGWREDDMSSD